MPIPSRFQMFDANQAPPRLRISVVVILSLGLLLSGCSVIDQLTDPAQVAARTVTLTASSSSVASGGGDIEMTVTVMLGGQAEAGVQVTFQTSAGTFVPDDTTTTDAAGIASRTLRTSEPATVTARVEAGSVAIATSNELQITVGGQASEAGNASFKITVSPKNALADEPTEIAIRATNPDGSFATGTLEVEYGDGKKGKVEGFAGEATLQHTYKEPSVFNLVVRLTEASGAVSTRSTPLMVVEAGATTVLLLPSTLQATAREMVTFTVRPQDDRGRLASGKVKIDWGDGRSTNLGEISAVTEVEHAFREPGNYRVLAELTNELGKTTRASVRIQAVNPVSITGSSLSATSTTPQVNQSISLTFRVTRSDDAGATGLLDVSFGDGVGFTALVSGGSAVVSHAYTAVGGYTIEADFVDSDGRTARATLGIAVQPATPGGGGGGTGGGGGGTGGGGGSASDELDASQIVWLHANAANWSVTSTVTSTSVSSGQICIDHTAAGTWPVFDGAEGNPWIIANVGGTWYAGTYEWLRPGQVCKSLGSSPPSSTITTLIGPHVKASPLESWVPRSGEVVYLMNSTLGRAGLRTSDERTNIVRFVWP